MSFSFGDISKDINKLIKKTRDKDRDELFLEVFGALQIINKEGRLVPYQMWPEQQELFDYCLWCRKNEIPTRIIVVKERQIGISTFIEAFIFALCITYPNKKALVLAHHSEPAGVLFGMNKVFHEELPEDLQVQREFSNKKVIQFVSPHRSSLRVATAATVDISRSGTLNYVHLTEVAYYENPPALLAALSNCVPDFWDTLIAVESTSKGPGNWFEREARAAEAGNSQFKLFFFCFFDFPHYKRALEPGETLKHTPETLSYQEETGAPPETMKWLIEVGLPKHDWDWTLFEREYPATLIRAFQAAGVSFFHVKKVQTLLDKAYKPWKRGRFEFEDQPPDTWLETNVLPSPSGPVVGFIEDLFGPVSLYEDYDPKGTYCIGADVGHGCNSDYSVAYLLKHLEQDVWEEVANVRSNIIQPVEFAVVLFQLGCYFAWPILGIERQVPGNSAIDTCITGHTAYPDTEEYPNLYMHRKREDPNEEPTNTPGWETQTHSKAKMLAHFQSCVLNDRIIIHSEELLREMQGFARDDKSTAMVERYSATYTDPKTKMRHDDCIMAMAITLQMCRYALDPAHQYFGRITEAT